MATETQHTAIGDLTFDHGLPTPETRKKLYDDLDRNRGIEAVLWAEPAVNNALFKRAMDVAGVPNLGAMVYDKRMQPGQETLTPNQSVVYLYDNINLKDTGPVVYILPDGPVNAGFFDMWMRAVHDFGTVGTNKGKGDRLLLVPPGYKGTLPSGYEVIHPLTYQVFSITRITVNPQMSADQAVEIFKKVQTYPLKDTAHPPAKTLVFMGDPAHGGKEFRMNRPSGIEYWKLVHDIIDNETVEDRDRITLGRLAALGIERGQPFSPDEHAQKILIEAEQIGKVMMINESFSPRAVPRGLSKELYPGTHWENIQLLPDMTQEGPNYTYVVNRMVAFYQANGAQFIWAPHDFPYGLGQKYAAAYQDSKGDWLVGEKTYRLHVPANVPVADFWSAAAYDVDRRALIEAPQHVSEISPYVQNLKKNEDGSIDLYFGPKAPQGMESNWIQTIPGKAWFGYFRWYGPTKPYYDKSWKLTDFEPI